MLSQRAIFLALAFASAGSISAATIPAQGNASSLYEREMIQMEFTFWLTGCGETSCGSDLGCEETWVFGPGETNQPGECYPAPDYHYTTAQMALFNSAEGWSVDLYTSEGCNEYYKTITVGGCYSQPEGENLLSFRAHHSA